LVALVSVDVPVDVLEEAAAAGLRVSFPDAVAELLVDELVEADAPALPGSEALPDAFSSSACVAFS
jgi:hypothetical protein